MYAFVSSVDFLNNVDKQYFFMLHRRKKGIPKLCEGVYIITALAYLGEL